MSADFLQLSGKRVLVFGLANRKSVAFHVAKTLLEAGAEVLLAVRSEQRRAAAEKLFPGAPVFVCDVEFEDQIMRLRKELGQHCTSLDGVVHSIAFADYSDGMRPFHE